MESDMYKIPYVEHRKRMFEAYKRERRLKAALIITNGLWLIATVICCVR